MLQSFLSRALDPPDMAAMDHALSLLEELGAVSDTGEVTALGQHLVRLCSSHPFHPSHAVLKAILPLDLRLGKVSSHRALRSPGSHGSLLLS